MDQIPTKKGFFFLQYYYFLHDSVFMYELPSMRVACVLTFLMGSHTMLYSIVSPLGLCWVKGACMLSCDLPPALLAEWPGS